MADLLSFFIYEISILMARLLYLIQQRKDYKMNKLLGIAFLTLLLFGASDLLAQGKLSKKEQRKIEKAERKEAENELLEKRKAAYLAVVKDSSIVLEANSINVNNRVNHQVASDNFVKISGDQVVIQTSNPGNIGYNGLGGVTLIGNINSYKIIEEKKSNAIRVSIQFSSQQIGHSSLILSILPSGYSTAYLTDNHGNNVTFIGTAYSVEGSTVYQGQTMFY